MPSLYVNEVCDLLGFQTMVSALYMENLIHQIFVKMVFSILATVAI